MIYQANEVLGHLFIAKQRNVKSIQIFQSINSSLFEVNGHLDADVCKDDDKAEISLKWIMSIMILR
jgi:hypothetical protein